MKESGERKPSDKQKRTRLGKVLPFMAGLAAASPTVANAQAITPYDRGGPQHYEVVGKKPQKQTVQPQIADPWKATVTPAEPKLKSGPVLDKRRGPSVEDAKLLGEYLVLEGKLQGLYLQSLGVEKNLPQFEAFCRELAAVCEKLAGHRKDVTNDTVFTPELFAQISEINREANQKIAPMSDMQQYQAEEKWTIPIKAGDCEDYVLLKMFSFIDEGFDPKHLHILVVYDEKKEGHAVLGIDVISGKGTRNTVILDNKTNDIIPLEEMEAKYKGDLASFITRTTGEGYRVRFLEYISGDDDRPASHVSK